MDSALFIKALGGMFAIMNPFVALPLFLSLTEGYSDAEQRRTGLRVALFSAIICALVAASGAAVLKFFGISVNDFRVAGGLVLMTIAMGMLNGSGNPGHDGPAKAAATQKTHNDISFYPMAFPMVVGPGTITAIIVFMGQAKDAAGIMSVAAAISLVVLAMALVLWFSSSIGHHMSQTLRVIMTRLMGMILAAIGVDMIATGLKALLPGLAG